MTRFVNVFAEIAPTIITGWNTEGFDIPYLINRIKRLLGMGVVNNLSPVGIVNWNKHRDKYTIFGVSSLDYMRLYKNYTYIEKPNYRLDTIARLELGRGKVEYDGDLTDLFESDIVKFIEYNMVDVDLVVDLEKKLEFIVLAQTTAHKGHVPYEDVYYASKVLDGAAIVDLHRDGFIAPNKQFRFVEDEEEEDLLGAFVMPVTQGLFKWVYDLDLTALYPSIIMTLNISPETLMGIFNEMTELTMSNTGAIQLKFTENNGTEINIPDVRQWLKDNNYKVASNGAVYRQDIKGFLPSILERWFNERVEFKRLRDQYDEGTPEYKFYDAQQGTQKVLLNSFYGVLGLKTFRFYNLINAGAITATGQSIIKFTAMIVNNYYSNITKKDHFINESGRKAPYSFYTDTDSTFVSSLPVIEKRYPNYDITDEKFMVEKTVEIAQEVQAHINKMYSAYAAQIHNAVDHRFQIKQEMVAKSGFWVAKKNYAQHVIFKEGKPTDKLAITGLASKKSNFPQDFKKVMDDVLWKILREESKQDTTDLVMDFKENLHKSHYLNVMNNTGVNGMKKWGEGRELFGHYTPRTPVHVKAALNYNDLLKESKLKMHAPINSGEKIKWAWLLDNPYGFKNLALVGDKDPPFIEDFIEKYIDKNTLFDRSLRTKLDDFYEANNWGKLPANNNMKKFFNFEKE